MSSNDNDHPAVSLAATASADAHGQAALMLVESLMHGLIQRSVLTTDDSIEIVGSALEVQADVAEAADGEGARMWQAHSLLMAISSSLHTDAHGGHDRPLM